MVHRTTAYRHFRINEQQCGDQELSEATANQNVEPDQEVELDQDYESLSNDYVPDENPEQGHILPLDQDTEQCLESEADQNQDKDAIKKYVLRTLKNKVRFGWSREETLSQLDNFYEYSLDEDIPHKSWQEVKAFLKTIGYHDPTVHKVCLAEDHVQLLNKTDNECPICNKDRKTCIDYYVLGINLDIFIDKYTIQNNMAHWEDQDNWFNKDTPECPRKELWHGQRFLQLSYFFDQNKESPLPVICKHCNSIVSINDIATRRTELGIDNVYESFEYTCCTCYSVFELWPKFMRGCPLNQAYLFHEDGFNAFTRRSRSIATIQISNACSHKQSRSTQNNFHVYSFIPTVHLSDGIVHKLDAFFQPLIDEITDLYLHGTIINLEEQVEINGHILAAGEHCVRALLLLGTADLKAHQDVALYTGGLCYK